MAGTAVFEPRDDQELAELLKRLADDPDLYNRVSESALERAKLYALDTIGQRLFSCLREVIGRKGKNALTNMPRRRHERVSVETAPPPP